MNREILFRGKDAKTGEWRYGFYWACLDPCSENTRWKGHFIHNGVNIQEPWEVDPTTIGQFTGLIDKNGKKIFEGDVIDTLIVSYCGDTGESLGLQAGWYLQKDNWGAFTPLESSLTDVVVGNIHDNPELIK